MTAAPIIFCAIDTDDLIRAKSLAAALAPITGGLKLGLEFVNAHGPQGIEAVMNAAPDAALFLDLKLHDIPNTVASAVRAICKRFSPAYLNVHASGGREMMQAAKDACGGSTKLLGVTILTSMTASSLAETGITVTPATQVERLARLTLTCGLDGIVCSGHEIALVRGFAPPPFALMVPGIRPADARSDDQNRVMTPQEALRTGATHLVIGRPITQSHDPAAAAAKILSDISA